MTINESIQNLKEILDECTESEDAVCYITNVDATALEMSIKALGEIQQYRKIGTVEECRKAVEKQIAKKPEFVDTRFMNNGKHISDGCQLQKCYKCPNCNKHIFHVWDDELYCKYCGQHIDWRDEDGKTD